MLRKFMFMFFLKKGINKEKRLCKKIMKSFNKTASKLKNPGNFMIWWLVILSSTPGCICLYICSVGPPGLGGGAPEHPPPSTPLQEGAKGGHAQGDAHATQPPPYYAPGDRFVTLKNGRILEPSNTRSLNKRIYYKPKETVLVMIIMIKHHYFTLLIKKS